MFFFTFLTIHSYCKSSHGKSTCIFFGTRIKERAQTGSLLWISFRTWNFNYSNFVVFSILSFKICSFYPLCTLSKHWQLEDHVYRYIYRQSFPSKQQQNKKKYIHSLLSNIMLATRKTASNKIEFYSFKYLADKVCLYHRTSVYTFFSWNTISKAVVCFLVGLINQVENSKIYLKRNKKKKKTFYSQINFDTSKKGRTKKGKNDGNNKRLGFLLQNNVYHILNKKTRKHTDAHIQRPRNKFLSE